MYTIRNHEVLNLHRITYGEFNTVNDAREDLIKNGFSAVIRLGNVLKFNHPKLKGFNMIIPLVKPRPAQELWDKTKK